jgi:2-phosphoglycerate kinase
MWHKLQIILIGGRNFVGDSWIASEVSNGSESRDLPL